MKAVTQASAPELFYELENKLDQLEAMLVMTTGQAGEAMRMVMPSAQIDSYMFACTELARSCSALFNTIPKPE